MRILILGGDGYLGWPQALYFSANGKHEVAIFDNFVRRSFDIKHSVDSLVPIKSLKQRVLQWKEITSKNIEVFVGDVLNYQNVSDAFRSFMPEAVIHFAEQRSAPYSMIDREHAVETQINNVIGTLNIVYAIKEFSPNCHLVKLGTMGEYGTPNIDIEEGFLSITHNGRTDNLPYPKQPGSFYHLSKVHDSHNIMFCCRVWGLRSTDLNQGIVYGVETDQTKIHSNLATRFDYDQVYGTALNRFCSQAAIGHPLTIYGQGGQTRGYINILDTLRCIELAVETPPSPGEYRVFNQITESFSISALATRVQSIASQMGIKVTIQHTDNPRVEAENHYYNPKHSRLLELGLVPHLLTNDTISKIIDTASKFKNRIDTSQIIPTVDWRFHNNIF